jgi:hypothetical protein
MNWLHDASYFFAGAFLTNGIPHFVSGLLGRPFQTPFAKPRGQGLSSSTINVIWGFFNFVVGYILGFKVGNFNWQTMDNVVALGAGILLVGVLSACVFGRFHGGNSPQKP